MAHSEITLAIAAGFVSRHKWSSHLPDHIPEWKLAATPRLEDDRTQKLKSLFREYDADKSGTISSEELRNMFSRLGINGHKDIDAMMKEADKDNSGVIDLNEFIDWLYDVESMGSYILDYGSALRTLFDVYDKSGSGTITYQEFEDAHCLLQGALRIKPIRDEEDHPIDTLGLNQDAGVAFGHANGDINRYISFLEFVEYTSKMIDPALIKQEEFCEVTIKLSMALKELLKGIQQAENGEIAEDDSHVLAAMISDLADTTREFHEALQGKDTPTKTSQRWVDPPRGMSIEQLKATHMKHMPVNFLLVDRFMYDVICVPKIPEGAEQTSERVWIGEVVRRVTYKSGVVRTEPPRFYAFDAEQSAWKLLEGIDEENFTNALRAFDPEFGLFCIMKCEADYGKELSWKGVKNALHAGVILGWLTAGDQHKYCQHMESITLAKLQYGKGPDGIENPEEAVNRFLYSSLIQRPRVVMATLSKLGIVDVHPMWTHFMSASV